MPPPTTSAFAQYSSSTPALRNVGALLSRWRVDSCNDASVQSFNVLIEDRAGWYGGLRRVEVPLPYTSRSLGQLTIWIRCYGLLEHTKIELIYTYCSPC